MIGHWISGLPSLNGTLRGPRFARPSGWAARSQIRVGWRQSRSGVWESARV